jgi:photosystem II stability/assembly factor-like uncharacterized protein
VVFYSNTKAQTFTWESVEQYKGGNVKTSLISKNNYIIVGVESRGIYVSSDNGITWFSSGMQNATITSLAYNLETDQYYAGTEESGLFVSKDEGKTWSLLDAELIDYKINNIEIDISGNILICTDKGFFTCSNEGKNLRELTNGLGNEEFFSSLTLLSGDILVSSTNGVFISTMEYRFNALNTGLSNKGISSLIINPTGTIYAGGVDGIYELADNFLSWKKIDTLSILKNIKTLNTDDDGNIYAGTMEAVYISVDSGKTFKEIFNNLSPINSIIFNTSKDIFVSTEKGFYSQKNNWNKIGIPLNLFVNQLFYDGDSYLYSASTDGLYKLNISNLNTELLTSNLGIIPVYSVTKNESYIFIGTSLGIYRSSNERINWTRINTGLPNFNINYLFSIGTTQLCGTNNGLFISSDNGNSWSQISSIPITASVNSILQTDQNSIIVGTSIGLYISTDIGRSWRLINTGFGNINISFLDINNSLLIAGNYNTLYKSSDKGTTWSIFASNFNRGLIQSIAVTSFEEVYVGTNEGAFRSVNNGTNWIELKAGLSNVFIRTLKLIGNSYLFAGTYGGSIFTTPPLSSDIPILVSPINHSIDQPKNITLRWNATPNTLLYRLQLSLLPDFSQLLLDDITFSNSLNVTNLQDLTKYYWRVNSSNYIGESYWSDVWEFTTIFPPPSTPNLIAPKHDSLITSSNLVLNWEQSERAESYDVQIALNSGFDPFVVSYIGVNRTEFRVNNIELFQTYYWRVRGHNITGSGDWSQINRFTFDPHTPGTPILLYPQDWSTLAFNGDENEVILKWSSAKKAQTYWLSISTDNSFQNIIINENSIVDTFFVLSQVQTSRYYWRVKAINDSGEGAWSEIYAFISSVSSTNKPSEVLPYTLLQNYPNPFNPETIITFSIPEKDFVSISVFDIHGRKVATLVNAFYDLGQHSVKFIPQNIASGIYYYQIRTSKFVDSKKMVYIK